MILLSAGFKVLDLASSFLRRPLLTSLYLAFSHKSYGLTKGLFQTRQIRLAYPKRARLLQ